MTSPIYYKLRFCYLDSNNPFKITEIVKDFDSGEPIKDRINAFQEFIEFENWINYLDEISRNKLFHFDKTIDYPDEFIESYDRNKNELGLTVYFVYKQDIEDNKKGDELCIHGINQDPLVCWDNLYWEYEIYLEYSLSTFSMEKEIMIYHPEERDFEKETILETPFDWKEDETFQIDEHHGEGSIYNYPTSKDEDLKKNKKEEIGETVYEEEGIENDFPIQIDENYIMNIIKKGEGQLIEFKPSLVYNFTHKKETISVQQIVAKTICSFLNSHGGLLLIGIRDANTSFNDLDQILGLDSDLSLSDKKDPKDWFRLKFDDLFNRFIGIEHINKVFGDFVSCSNGKTIYAIQVKRSEVPVYLKKYDFNNQKNTSHFYVRASASTHEITDLEKQKIYIDSRFGQRNN